VALGIGKAAGSPEFGESGGRDGQGRGRGGPRVHLGARGCRSLSGGMAGDEVRRRRPVPAAAACCPAKDERAQDDTQLCDPG
jgi:hypothetical protein